MYVSLTSDSSETTHVIIIKLATVTVLDMRMHHMLITKLVVVIDINIGNNDDSGCDNDDDCDGYKYRKQ